MTMHKSHLPNAETLLVHFRRIEQLKRDALTMPSLLLGAEELCDLELLLHRSLFPMQGYMNKAEYESVLDSMRLPGGEFWPLPVVLAAERSLASQLRPGDRIALRDQEGFMLAVLFVEDVWEPDLAHEAKAVFGTADAERHPGVARLMLHNGSLYIGGRVEGIHMPQHYDFASLRRTPAELHRFFSERGWTSVIGFQHDAPLHRMHREMLLAAALETGGKLLISPLIGPAFLSDVSHFTLVRCLQHFMKHLPPNLGTLHLTPMRRRGAGPRGALMQALLNRNYGCTHFLVHEHHDAPLPQDTTFYPARAAFEAVDRHKADLDIEPLLVRPRVYVREFDMFSLPEEVNPGVATLDITRTELKARLLHDEPLPEWFSFPEVIEEICRAMPPRCKQGFTVFLTGLSGAGKSTLAKVLYVKLLELQDRPVTLLDGDIVRRNLSSELSFSEEHRNLNVRRIGFVASEITKNRGIAICAPIAPYAHSRTEARDIVEQYGGFVEVFVSTPLEVCEQRDRKGLYAKARAGLIKGVTGVDDPYEAPATPDVDIDTTEIAPSEGVETILQYLRQQGFLKQNARSN